MLVKTGCSSSMVALHLAAEAVQNGTCTSAMALGCNLITSVITSIVFTETGVLSPSGKCKTFDLLADGYGRGEAVNAVFVKKMSDALRDGNPIRAVIRSSGTNNDGRSNGIMNPNTYLQEALIRRTYEKAGITDYSKTAFFECHGTGTPTGDPLEVAAVARIWKEFGGVKIGAVRGSDFPLARVKSVQVQPANVAMNDRSSQTLGTQKAQLASQVSSKAFLPSRIGSFLPTSIWKIPTREVRACPSIALIHELTG